MSVIGQTKWPELLILAFGFDSREGKNNHWIISHHPYLETSIYVMLMIKQENVYYLSLT